jgi:hypothetical protein
VRQGSQRTAYSMLHVPVWLLDALTCRQIGAEHANPRTCQPVGFPSRVKTTRTGITSISAAVKADNYLDRKLVASTILEMYRGAVLDNL